MKRSEVLAGAMAQPLKFGLVGVLNTVVYYLAYLLALALAFDYLLAAVISHVVGVTNSFVWNKYWTFRSDGEARKELIRFVAVYTITFGGNLLLLFLMVERLRWDAKISQAIAITIVAATSFFGHRYWSFRQAKRVDLGQ